MIINKVQVYNFFVDIVRMDNVNRSTAGVIDVLTISNDIKILSELVIFYELNIRLTQNILSYCENL